MRDIGELLSLARKEQELLTKKNKVANVSEQARTLVEHQAFGDALSLLEKTLVDTSDTGLRQFLEKVRAQAAEFDASLDVLKQEVVALLDAGHSAEALTKLQSQATKFGHSPGFSEFLRRVEERTREEQESKQQVARVLDEARLYLRRGALHEAEAALAECRAKAPRDAGVVALSSQLVEAKAALERQREIQPPPPLDLPPYPQPKASPAAAATVMFNPGAAVADLTPPPVGTPMESEEVAQGISAAAASPVPVEAEERDADTVLYRIPVEPPVTPIEGLNHQSHGD